ncbi:substrate-binding domain-containing protein [Demequina lutea]|uniref:Simple sugar transport system substrate-binding protein n=1 Tax=Demequina lutea TaxID=431489 RepID=A0A7Y9ZBG4_9MICO|nr:substrate-binding domain-containing protein [Demequina lutea]NYI42322.1 simple sugar transport system substrate-binding protein [Demequina lutea]
MSVKKHLARVLTVAAVGAIMLGLAACSTSINGVIINTAATNAPTVKPLVTVGFVAVGAADAWHAAEEADIQSAFSTKAGFDLKYAPATKLDQKSQIDAFNAFVDQGVKAILLSPVQSSGWDDSLTRAKNAGIPVFLIDGGISPDNTSLYVTRITPGDAAVATNVANWALGAFPDGTKYFVLEGPAGDGMVSERNQGWNSVLASHPEFSKIGAQAANWTTDEAKSVTAAVLKANNNDVPLIFAQNDEMGLGAVQAVEEAGLKPGTDVKIVTIGGSKAALQALLDGKLSFVAEYNPLLGQTAAEVVNTVLGGDTVDTIVVVPSATFATVTQDQVDARVY